MNNVKKGGRKESILISAAKIFGKKGYYNSNINDIIKSAGIARGTFYLYFKSKRDVFNACFDALIEDVKNSIKIVDITSEISVFEQVYQNVERIFKAFMKHKSLTEILIYGWRGVDRNFQKKVVCFYKDIGRMIESAIMRGKSMGVLRNEIDSEIIATSILGIVKEVMAQILVHRKKKNAPLIIKEILKFALEGILNRTTISF